MLYMYSIRSYVILFMLMDRLGRFGSPSEQTLRLQEIRWPLANLKYFSYKNFFLRLLIMMLAVLYFNITKY